MAQRMMAREPVIDPGCSIRDSRIGEYTWIGANSSITESSFGDYSYAAGNVQILYSAVGKWCSIASHVRLNPSNHPWWRVTQHHATYRRVQYGFGEDDDEEIFRWRRANRVVIGHDVWIGHAATVMPGVTVGTGAIIGSAAVVTHDVEPYMVVVGVPARPIRERFSREVAERLMRVAYWDWTREQLEERFPDFYDLERFLAKYDPR